MNDTRNKFDEAIELLFNNLNIGNFEDSYHSMDFSGEPNTMIKVSVDDKIDNLREIIFDYVDKLEKSKGESEDER